MNTQTLIVIIIVLMVFAVAVYAALSRSGSGSNNIQNDIKNKLKTMPSSSTDNPHELKSILVEYDKLMDYYLKQKRFPGETMGERLKSARSSFDRDTYNKIWTAHKLRNTLVHEFGIKVDPKIIRNEIFNLRKVLEKA